MLILVGQQIKYCALLFLLFFAVPIFSHETLDLDWQKCVKLALKNNYSLKAAKESINESRYKYLAGINAFLPQISASNTFSRSGGNSLDTTNKWSVDLYADENLFNLKSMSSIKMDKLFLEKSLEDYKVQSAVIRHDLYLAFINLLYAQEKIKVEKKISEIRQTNAKLIRLKYESGMESKGNAMYAESLWELARTNVRKAERDLLVSRKELARHIGVEENTEIVAYGSITVAELEFNMNNVQDILEKIPQIVSLKKSAEIYRHRLLSAKYDLYPSLSLSQSLSWRGERAFPSNKSWSIGVSLRLPLFSNGITYYFNNVNAAKSALRNIEEKIKELKISTEKNIFSAYNDFLNAKESALANKSVLLANNERYKEARIKYMAGKISFVELVNVEQNLVDAELNNLEYAKNAALKKIYFEKIIGKTLED